MMMYGMPSSLKLWTRLDQFAQDSSLSQLECDACVRALLSPQSDLILAPAMTMLATDTTQDSTPSHNEFALCLRMLLRPSLALSPTEFAACMRALISLPVPPVLAGIQCRPVVRLGDEDLHTSQLLFCTLRRLLSDNIPHPNDMLLAFPPQNVLYPPAVRTAHARTTGYSPPKTEPADSVWPPQWDQNCITSQHMLQPVRDMLTVVMMWSTKRSSACKHERIKFNKHLYIIVWCAVFPTHDVLTADNMCGLVTLTKLS